ncbi:MAG: DUF1543 domain-containing protein [Methylovirgula sp.]
MKLFMFYVGGNCGASNIELHDVRFSVGQTPEDCYADLRRQWWGDPESLHLDSWGAVEQADGYDISAVEGASGGEAGDKLFFVNLGGYDPGEFGELHKNLLLVAPDAQAAKAKALAQIPGWFLPHKDRIFEVEKAIDLTAFMEARGYSLRLKEAAAERPFSFTCNYVPIG